MPTVYKATTATGDFVAFWKPDKNTISYFNPASHSERYASHSLANWKSERTSYRSHGADDLDAFPDVVNAAWHYAGRHGMLIAKHTAVRSTIEPGIYYPRIWRAYYHERNFYMGYNPINPRAAYGNKQIQSVLAASSLFDNLVEIFRHVEPTKRNFRAFGHKIRELLILVCTEIEVGWRYVLVENTDPAKTSRLNGRHTTRDYFKVKKALRLNEWAIALKEYPDLGTFKPFARWNGSQPTKSLPWYDAYNAVKHDREASFSHATLENLLNAMAALHIMQAAQWGVEVYSRWHEDRFSPFRVIQFPTFRLSEIYMPRLDGSGIMIPALYFER